MNADLLRSKVEVAVATIPEEVLKNATHICIEVSEARGGATVSVSPQAALDRWVGQIKLNVCDDPHP